MEKILEYRQTENECQITTKGTHFPLSLLSGLLKKSEASHFPDLCEAVQNFEKSSEKKSICLFRLFCQATIHFQALTSLDRWVETKYDLG